MRENRIEKMAEIQKKLEDGTKAVFTSDKYKDYLKCMSKFPAYSINNCILIAMQREDASLVCGYRAWEKDFNRHVNKGEKGIMILAPMKFKQKVDEEVYDSNHNLVRDANGNVVTEQVEREFCNFRPVYVFDVSQTTGDELPSITKVLNDEVSDFSILRDVILKVSPVPVSFAEIKGGANGFYSPKEQKIVIKENLPKMQMLKTMVHECAHAMLGHGSKDEEYDRSEKEVQAESVAYMVCELLGFDTSEYSFGYISGWSKDKEVSELKEHLTLIKRCAEDLFDSIEKELKVAKQIEDEVLVKPHRR